MIGKALNNIYLGGCISALIHSSSMLFYSMFTFYQEGTNAFLFLDFYYQTFNPLDQLHELDQFFLCVSIGYFLSDLYVVTFVKPSKLFQMHHVACILSFLGFQICNQERHLLLAVIFCGEITNPLQNVFESFRQVARQQEQQGQIQQGLKSTEFQFMLYFFTFFFYFVRIVWTPCVLIYRYYFYRVIHVSTSSPWWLLVFPWYLLIVMILLTFGGFKWSLDLARQVRKFRATHKTKESTR